MTDDNALVRDAAPSISFSGVPLHQRLSAEAPRLTASVVDRLVGRLPVYASLPKEALRGDVARVVGQEIRNFVEVLRTGRQPDAAALAVVRESAARRAEEGVPLEAVVSAYFVSAQVCTGALLGSAAAEDVDSVVAAQDLLLEYLRLVTSTVTAGYLDERRAALSEEHGARQTLLAALLDGSAGAGDAADRAGIELPCCYVVVSLAIGPHPDEAAEGVDHHVAARRKLRRLRTELDLSTRGAALAMLSVRGGVVLLPSAVAAEAWGEEEWSRLGEDVARLGRVSGADLTAAGVPAAPDGVAEAARVAAEIRGVAEASGRGPGVYRLSDVLLEYQLTRPGPARDQLAALLLPLSGHPELLDTLRAFVICGLDRRGAAAALHVHPNTVDYRLRKVTALTGLDPTKGAALPTLHAALTAHDASGRG